jgi:hypothetical protein
MFNWSIALAAVLGALSSACLPASPSAAPTVAAPANACPYDGRGQTYDGCDGAPAQGSFFNPNLAQAFTQSGQRSGFTTPGVAGYPHPPNYNIPGMDPGYRVGYDTASPLKIPTHRPDGSTNLPPGCAFAAPRAPWKVVCRNIDAASGTAVIPRSQVYPAGQHVAGALVIDHFDFDKVDYDGVEIDGVCVALQFAGTVHVPKVISNNRFRTETDCIGANRFLFRQDATGAYDLFFIQNEVDGNYPTLKTDPFDQNRVQAASNMGELNIQPFLGASTVLYNHIHNCRTRCANWAGLGVQDWEFNVSYAFNLLIGAGNLEGDLKPDPAGGGDILTVTNMSGNTGVVTGGFLTQGATINAAGGAATILYQLSGAPNGTGTYKLRGDPCVGGAPCKLLPLRSPHWGVYEDNQHGEFVEYITPFGKPDAPVVQAEQLYAHNFVAVPNTVSSFAGTTTSPIYMQTNSDKVYTTINLAVLDGNVEITNGWKDPKDRVFHTNVSSAGSNVSYNHFGKLIIRNNWIDPNGAVQCYANPNRLATIEHTEVSGNRSLYDGSAVTADGFGPNPTLAGACAGQHPFQ